MQTVPPSVCFAKIASSILPTPSEGHGFKNIRIRCSFPVNAPVQKSLGLLVIRCGASAEALRFAHRASQSASAVRLPGRLEMLQRRAKPVRRSRFAPAALPSVS